MSDIWVACVSFPRNARLDYKVVVDDNSILDPVNPYQQRSGFGMNSELRMPEWKYPEETLKRPDITRGTRSENIMCQSSKLNYSVQYTVYTPYDYTNLSNLPVIYVADGQEYATDNMGSMQIVLDNLIYDKKIRPVIAVFIDPREPENLKNNRRNDEYTMNPLFADFVADELVPEIDKSYKTDPCADSRAILGASYGGLNAAYFGAKRPDTFHLIAIHSPGFSRFSGIYSLYENSDALPLKIFMSTGTIYDTQDSARKLKRILDEKGYPLEYIEVPEGHSWGNWRALLEEPLEFFFANRENR